MRILHVDPAATWRGGERQVFLLARELVRRGHDCVVAADPGGVLIRRVRGLGLRAEPLPIRGDLDLAASVRAALLLRKHRPDILHLHTARAHGGAGIGARLAGFRPVLVTRRLELPVRGMFGRWKYRCLADHYIAISRAVERALLGGGVPGARITRIPSGVEIASGAPERRSRPDRPWTVDTLGAFTPQKDPETWLATVGKVAALVPEARFVWAGGGELAPRVKVGIEEAGLSDRVLLPGFLEDVEPFWSRIDVFFLPSAFEALGTVLLDALRRGIPVVATCAGGIPEVVRPGREGLLSSPGDVDNLADSLVRLRREPELAARLGAAGRQRAGEYEIGKVVDRIVELYERLAAPHAGGTTS